jgi:hypothetical protein
MLSRFIAPFGVCGGAGGGVPTALAESNLVAASSNLAVAFDDALTPSWSAPLMVDSFARAGKTDPPLSSHPLADLGG